MKGMKSRRRGEGAEHVAHMGNLGKDGKVILNWIFRK
jgi:hypothetical protein